jgi:hypothetical protein
MSRIATTLFSCAVVVLLFAAAPAAQAQMECSECHPQYSYCAEECWYCWPPHIDYCPQQNVQISTENVAAGSK